MLEDKRKLVQFIQCSEEQIQKLRLKNEIFEAEETENEMKVFFDPDKIYFEVEDAKGNIQKMDGKLIEKLEWWKDED